MDITDEDTNGSTRKFNNIFKFINPLLNYLQNPNDFIPFNNILNIKKGKK